MPPKSSAEREREWTAWGLVLSLLVPFVGVVLGLRLLLRERLGPGLALILVGVICWGAWAGVYFVSATHSHHHPTTPAVLSEQVPAEETEEQRFAREDREAPPCKANETTPVNGCKE